MRPLIGITTYAQPAVSWGPWTLPSALVPLSYIAAVERAGGRPLLVPPVADAVDETLDVLDGIVFSGGDDLDPGSYGAEAHPETRGTAPQRDDAEWCRRLFVRIIGRIPTVEELQAFTADRSKDNQGKDKRDKLVDRLLTDDNYVEEYSRHWATVWGNVLIGRTGGRGGDAGAADGDRGPRTGARGSVCGGGTAAGRPERPLSGDQQHSAASPSGPRAAAVGAAGIHV